MTTGKRPWAVGPDYANPDGDGPAGAREHELEGLLDRRAIQDDAALTAG